MTKREATKPEVNQAQTKDLEAQADPKGGLTLEMEQVYITSVVERPRVFDKTGK